MRWGKTIDERGWQQWFAWRPVQLITGRWIWLEWVERGEWYLGPLDVFKEAKGGPLGWTYVYRSPDDARTR